MTRLLTGPRFYRKACQAVPNWSIKLSWGDSQQSREQARVCIFMLQLMMRDLHID